MTRDVLPSPPGAAPRKRSSAAVRSPEEGESTRKRLKNIWKSDKNVETLQEALEEISFLKSHLKAALEFIDETETAMGKRALSNLQCLAAIFN